MLNVLRWAIVSALLLPLLLVTAERSAELSQACAARGVAILYKPIDAMALREVMAGLDQAKGLTTKGA